MNWGIFGINMLGLQCTMYVPCMLAPNLFMGLLNYQKSTSFLKIKLEWIDYILINYLKVISSNFCL